MVSLVVYLLATVKVLPTFWPKFEIKPVDISNPQQAFSQAFEVKNASPYPVCNVKFTTFSRRLVYPNNFTMGMNAYSEGSMNYSQIDPGDSATISFVKSFGGQTPISADIGIEMVYMPMNAFKKVKLFGFNLSQDTDGKFTWRKQPANKEFEKEWDHFKAVQLKNAAESEERMKKWNQIGNPAAK